MNVEILQSIVFWSACILYVINSLGIDTLVSPLIETSQYFLERGDHANKTEDLQEIYHPLLPSASSRHQINSS